jgi:hypothetical protein
VVKKLKAEKETRLHPEVSSFVASAHKDIMKTLDKHKARHLQMRADVEKRALAGDSEALKQYRHLVRLETIWKTVKERVFRDLQSLTDAVVEVEPKR